MCSSLAQLCSVPARGDTKALLGGTAAAAPRCERTIDVKITFHNPKFSFELLRRFCSEGKALCEAVIVPRLHLSDPSISA